MQSKNPLSIQLWSLRDYASENYLDVFKVAAEAGFKAVEMWPSDKASPQEIADAAKKHGLTVSGAHIGMDRLRADLDGVIEEAKTVGYRHVICPFLDPKLYATAASCVAIGEEFNQIGEKVREAGLRFSFHNHGAEFRTVEGKYALDWALEACEPRNVGLELDCDFVHTDGPGGAAYLRQQGARAELVHLKDGTKDGETPLAQGDADLEGAVAVAREIGAAAWFVAEHGLWKRGDEEKIREARERLEKFV